jgi:hypothetical protein
VSESAEKMRSVGDKIATDIIPGVGFILVVWEPERGGLGNYVSNVAKKAEIIAALEEVLEKMKHFGGNGKFG